ncbi:hypothetical protein JCM10908_007094 [Rhodotorula pacifica]|uniref:uncharacterized protein n=1 Tax=Rhodotorula pacifica TaxID=1495444 RepID=UPI003179E2F2
MTSHKRTLPPDFLALSNPIRPPASRRRALDSSIWTSTPWTRQTALKAHHSCVNALAFSPAQADGARWLASGGDDKRVLLWDTADHDAVARDGIAPDPVASYVGASSNLFTIAFTSDGKKILSGGNDCVVMVHDLEYSAATPAPNRSYSPSQVYLDHQGAIMSISSHPSNPSLFLTASSDGSLLQFDLRSSSARAVAAIFDEHDMEHVQYHPLTPEVFVYGGERGNLGVIDGRTGWSTGNGEGAQYSSLASKVAVHKFHTRLTRGFPSSQQNPPSSSSSSEGTQPQRFAYPTVSSFSLDSTGSLLCATLSGYLPTLYELNEAEPLACFASPPMPPPLPSSSTADVPQTELAGAQAATTSTTTPDSALAFPSGYRNTTTTKHGSFGGGLDAGPGRGLYYAAGSDDFRAYVWEVPRLEGLREGRRKGVKAGDVVDYGIRFLDSTSLGPLSPSTYPTLISPATQILTGHRSIVNTALFHPTLPLLYTSGVEKVVVRHAPALGGGGGSFAAKLEQREDRRASSSHAQGGEETAKGWHFVPRQPAAHFAHPGLSGPSDPSDDDSPRSGESTHARDLRLREEDLTVLQYFDGLVQAEGEDMLWREDSDSDFQNTDSEEEDEEDAEYLERLREVMQAEGPLGSTRRVLDLVYALEERDAEDE